NILGLWVAQDFDRSGQYAAFLLQGGLDMPDRDYYLDASDRMKDIRAKFVTHLATILNAAGVADADAKAQRIAELQHRIAEGHATREASVEVKNAKRWTRAAFDQNAPGMDWNEFFAGARLPSQPEFVLWHPQAVTGISALVASQPLDTWKEYLTEHALEHFA